MYKDLYIQRCFDLSQQGVSGAAPNPMVGAVLVYKNEIIGEGFHRKHGEGHAEVAALASVPITKQSQIPESTLFVSLEPCCIVGNTPACSDLILKQKIQRIVYSVSDPTPGVNGTSKGILQSAGRSVESNIQTEMGNNIIKIRTTWVKQKRPYIILKYAESADGFIGKAKKQVWLSNNIAKIVSHKWRSEVDAILIGTNTAITDNPKLDNRLYSGSSPLRIVIDKSLKLTKDLHLLSQKQATWVFTEKEPPRPVKNLTYFQIKNEPNFIPSICQKMYKEKKGVLLVEGGAKLLQSFIDAGFWDEVRVFKTPVVLGSGIPSPKFSGNKIKSLKLKDNILEQWMK